MEPRRCQLNLGTPNWGSDTPQNFTIKRVKFIKQQGFIYITSNTIPLQRAFLRLWIQSIELANAGFANALPLSS